jgi:hypothetical protein
MVLDAQTLALLEHLLLLMVYVAVFLLSRRK